MPTLNELLTRVLSLTTTPAVIGILVTTSLLIVSQDWRVNLIALAVQYFFGVFLLTRQIRLEMAAIKGLIGWLNCLVFYLTERSISSPGLPASGEDTPASRRWRRWVMSARASFGLLATLLIAVVAYAAARTFPLPVVSVDITVACYVLAGLGMLLVGLSGDPFKVGMGLLTFLLGFDLFYVALVPSLVVAGLLGAINFVIVLAMAYVKTTQFAARDEETAA